MTAEVYADWNYRCNRPRRLMPAASMRGIQFTFHLSPVHEFHEFCLHRAPTRRTLSVQKHWHPVLWSILAYPLCLRDARGTQTRPRRPRLPSTLSRRHHGAAGEQAARPAMRLSEAARGVESARESAEEDAALVVAGSDHEEPNAENDRAEQGCELAGEGDGRRERKAASKCRRIIC